MTLSERIEQTRSLCRDALTSPALAAAEERIARAGLTPQTCSRLLHRGAETKQPAAEFLALQAGTPLPDFALERALLVRTALPALDCLGVLPVDESVKHLFCREFSFYAKPPDWSREYFQLSGRKFSFMGGVVSLQRFPAGQYHWTLAGVPRSWLAKVSPVRLPGLCAFLIGKLHGFSPCFEPHLNSTTIRNSFVTEREYLKSFYRMAAAVELQPGIKGILAASWLYSTETHRVSPHLAFFNKPYLEAGGIVVDLGPADPDGGFLEGDPQRNRLYESGEYKPTDAMVLCSRAQAIAWKHAHPELENLVQAR